MIRLLRRTATVLAISLAATATGALIAPATPAYATNFGSTACADYPRSCVSVANNGYHAVRFSGLGDIPGIADATLWTLANVYNPTDLVAYRDESDPLPDVWVYDYNYGRNGVIAWVECPTNNTGTGGSHPNVWCRGQQLRYNAFYYYEEFGWYDNNGQRRTNACHELGHTVGLRHPGAGGTCMHTGPAYYESTTISAHERSHINGRY